MFNKYFGSKKLICFDFDGLLVDTEPLHHLAYSKVLDELGYPLDLDFKSYCDIAHSADRELFPKTVKAKYPNFPFTWTDIRARKTKVYRDLLKEGRTKPMPGAEKLIENLLKQDYLVCIVTNSDRCDVDEIKSHLPFLQKIPLIIAREDYDNPKPHPDGYLTALQKHNLTKEDAIGLEDTKKGISALKSAGMDYLLINHHERQDDHHFTSLELFSV